jgi:hypothetical protein
MQISAAIRESKAVARGARPPPMLRPARAMRPGSTSGRAAAQSMTVLTTLSQLGRNISPSR